MSAPGRIAIGAGVSTRNRSMSGVIRSKLNASEKKANTGSRGSGIHCHVLSV